MMRFLRRHAWWLVPLIVVDVLFFRWLMSRPAGDEAEESASDPKEAQRMSEPRKPLYMFYTYPTDQRDLWNTESAEVYQPTASGRVESALFGTTRTRSFGGRLLPAFHMGIDIASLQRDRRNRPLDEIYAVAGGRVAYINAVAGNSNYGIYVVLTHDDPVGEIYTLYAHLARVESGLRAGQPVTRGDVLGVMGNTSSTGGIPWARAHLHFEIGTIMNRRFDRWYRAQKLVPDHGSWHGHNLTGIDPLALYGERRGPAETIRFSLRDYLRDAAPAFSLLFEVAKPMDYFKRYPDLWEGPPPARGPLTMVMTVTEGGVPMRGRAATAAEADGLKRGTVQVLAADAEVLGRNGRRLVVRRGDAWVLAQSGKRWLEILTY